MPMVLKLNTNINSGIDHPNLSVGLLNSGQLCLLGVDVLLLLSYWADFCSPCVTVLEFQTKLLEVVHMGEKVDYP